MVYALALLLFSSLTCVGLFSIWAATSSQHWFLQTMLFLGVISTVLLIPAYEPFVAFLLQGAVVTAGVQLARWWRERSTNSAERRTRIALRTILLAMIPLAIVSAVAVRLPELNFRAWQSVVLIGLCAGGATLVGLWMAHGKLVRWWLRVLLGITLAGVISLVLFTGDWFYDATVQTWGWPPPEDDGTGWYLSGYYDDQQQPAWIAVIYLVVVCVAVVSWLLVSCRHSGRGPRKHSSYAQRCLSGAILLLITIVLLVPTVCTYYELMNPLPIPKHNLPNPNGYDDFLAAVNLLPSNMIVNGGNFDADTATIGQLQAAENELLPAIERVRKGLEKPAWKQVDYSSSELTIPDLQSYRSIARGLSANGKLAERQNDVKKAADTYLELMQFGESIGRGGLMIDVLVGMACTGIGCHGLYDVRNDVAPDDCIGIASRIAELENRLEPVEDVIHRDRVWTQHAYGWQAHLMQYLESESEKNSWTNYSFISADRLNHAILRLLQLEFALRAWKAEHGEWPESLAQMAPALISEVPIDPFPPAGNQLRYSRTDEGYLLYSVGQNEIDEGGRSPEDDGSGWHDPSTGDLRLDIHFAPDPPVNVGTGDDDRDGE